MHERTQLTWDTSSIAAYLFLHLGEPMPDESMSDVYFQEWALSPDPTSSITLERVDRFLKDVQLMLDEMEYADPDEYMSYFYDAAKRTFDGDKKMIRTWFTWLYLIMLEKTEGPRWGDFVQIYGFDAFADRLRRRIFHLSFVDYTYY